MKTARPLKWVAATLAASLLSASSVAELAPEPMPKVATLSADYPPSSIFVHDANFDALIAGRVVLLDVAAENHNYKGALDAAQFASFIESSTRRELYVTETFYSRGTRGERSDLLTIYDKENLTELATIELPGGKRGQIVSHRYTLQLVDRDRYLLLFNFTPAASVSVIDMEKREILNEIAIPGCGLVYPSGERGFSTLCSNGSLRSVQLDKAGQIITQNTVAPFFDIDSDPLFDKPVYRKQQAWFPSFHGDVQRIDFSGETAAIKERWSLLSEDEKAANWRPGGWQIASIDDRGSLYVLMHKDGFNGSHKSGGSEVWVYDLNKKQRTARFPLKNWGVSIEVTRGKQPYLVVTNADMQLDIYAANSGEWQKLIGGTAAMPFNLHALR